MGVLMTNLGQSLMDLLPRSYVVDYTTRAYNAMDAERDGKLNQDDKEWNVGHGYRNFFVLNEIIRYVDSRELTSLRVLNLSGMNEGKPDLVLFDLLKDTRVHLDVKWSIVDHPSSLTFTDLCIGRWVEQRGFECIVHDHRNGPPPVPEAVADIVLCTEILEHLDYSIGIALLRCCQRALRPGGVLIITTPNAVYLGHRVLFALGKWDFLHHMDEPKHVDQGVTGHTIYYDGRRLSRLLHNLNFVNVKLATFNAGHGPGEFRSIFTRSAAIMLRAASRFVPHSAQVLLASAERASS
jgi:SAM-dependent methyltransferase